MPIASTRKISAFSNGLLSNAVMSAPDRNSVSNSTAARKPSIRMR